MSTVLRTGDITELEINRLFGGWGDSTGQAWYDDLALEQLPDPSNEEPRALVIHGVIILCGCKWNYETPAWRV